MTEAEKRNYIKSYCNSRPTCIKCPLVTVPNGCYGEDADINKNFELIGGNDMLAAFTEFTKRKLEPGMVVVTREGNRYIVIDSYFIGKDGWDDLANYNDDLTSCNKDFSNLDIVKVYDKKCGSIERALSSSYLLWEREEIKEVTMSEVEKMFGCKVKIVKE